MRPEIEIFDLSHIHGARRLIDKGLMDERPHVQFVMGVQNAMPADERLLDILLEETRRVLPQATWTAAGIGPNQARVMGWVLARAATASGPGWRTTSASARTGWRKVTLNSCRSPPICAPDTTRGLRPPRRLDPCWGSELEEPARHARPAKPARFKDVKQHCSDDPADRAVHQEAAALTKGPPGRRKQRDGRSQNLRHRREQEKEDTHGEATHRVIRIIRQRRIVGHQREIRSGARRPAGGRKHAVPGQAGRRSRHPGSEPPLRCQESSVEAAQSGAAARPKT